MLLLLLLLLLIHDELNQVHGCNGIGSIRHTIEQRLDLQSLLLLLLLLLGLLDLLLLSLLSLLKKKLSRNWDSSWCLRLYGSSHRLLRNKFN